MVKTSEQAIIIHSAKDAPWVGEALQCGLELPSAMGRGKTH